LEDTRGLTPADPAIIDGFCPEAIALPTFEIVCPTGRNAAPPNNPDATASASLIFLSSSSSILSHVYESAGKPRSNLHNPFLPCVILF
jgi:hypothetical protein